jgi:hypothetical protein
VRFTTHLSTPPRKRHDNNNKIEDILAPERELETLEEHVAGQERRK